MKKRQNPKTPAPPLTYEMLGGGRITGRTPRELAAALRYSSYTPMESLREFVEDVAKRCAFYDHDAKVRTRPLSAFIEDLIRYGFLMEPQEKPANVIDFPAEDLEEGEQ